MNITPIQNNIYNNKIQKIQNFNGLWGQTTRIVDKDPVLGVQTDYETYYYYPFSDELPEEIAETVDKNSDAYFDEKQGDKYIVKECKVCIPLLFKKIHFENYQNADKTTRMTQNLKKVHYSVKDKYVNNTGEQVTAVNPEVKNRLDIKL